MDRNGRKQKGVAADCLRLIDSTAVVVDGKPHTQPVEPVAHGSNEGEGVQTLDSGKPSTLTLACSEVCGCVQETAALAQIWKSCREHSHTRWSCEPLAGALIRLTCHLKRARTAFASVAWSFRALYESPPQPVGDILGSCYHEIGIYLAEATVWTIAPAALLGCEILDPLIANACHRQPDESRHFGRRVRRTPRDLEAAPLVVECPAQVATPHPPRALGPLAPR